jgi:diphthamide synthase (EF-2-diphthine--ammonia ligase)
VVAERLTRTVPRAQRGVRIVALRKLAASFRERGVHPVGHGDLIARDQLRDVAKACDEFACELEAGLPTRAPRRAAPT